MGCAGQNPQADGVTDHRVGFWGGAWLLSLLKQDRGMLASLEYSLPLVGLVPPGCPFRVGAAISYHLSHRETEAWTDKYRGSISSPCRSSGPAQSSSSSSCVVTSKRSGTTQHARWICLRRRPGRLVGAPGGVPHSCRKAPHLLLTVGATHMPGVLHNARIH